MELLARTYFGDILHSVSQTLLLPTVVMLLVLILYALWCIGSIVVETVTEHRHFKVIIPTLMQEVAVADCKELPKIIAESQLLAKQKKALLTLWDYRCLPTDTHVALAKRLLEEQDDLNTKIISRTQTVSKIAPMFGLMGTLIPLGPGIYSLSMNDTATLSSSLLIAFDTTVAGLLVSLVTYTITKIRHRWYENYMTALEAMTTCILEKVDALREQGKLDATAPTHELEKYYPQAKLLKREAMEETGPEFKTGAVQANSQVANPAAKGGN